MPPIWTGAWTGAAADAVAADSGGIHLSVGPGRLVLQGPVSTGSAVGQVVVRVSAPFRVRVTATLADVDLGADGTPIRAPLGSTDWTLRNVTTLTGNAFDYVPGFDTATFTVTVTARAPAFEQPRVGLVVVTAVPVSAQGGDSAQASVSGIVITGPDAAAAPAVADAAPFLAVDGLSVSRQRWTGVDSLVGDPWRRLLDHGPATLTWRYDNNGIAAGETATPFRIWDLGPFGWLPWVHDEGSPVRTINGVVRVVLPGQAVTETLSTDVAATSAGSAWGLPAFGAVRITVETTSAVAGLSAPIAQQAVMLVIAPWKEVLAILAGLAGTVAALLLLRWAVRGVSAARRRRAAVVVALIPVRRGVPAVPARAPGVPARAPGVPAPLATGAPAVPAPLATPGTVGTPAPVPQPATVGTPPPVPQPQVRRKRIQAPPPKNGTPTV